MPTVSPVRLAIMLGTLVALGPLAIDTYLPALPTMADDFGDSIDQLPDFDGEAALNSNGLEQVGRVQLAVYIYIYMYICDIYTILCIINLTHIASSLNSFATGYLI